MGVLGFTETGFLVFFLVLVRMTGLFIMAPVFAHASVPAQVKAWFAFAVTLVVYPMVSQTPISVPGEVTELALAIVRELLVGFVVGYVALLLFAAAQYAGELIDTQIGFGMANLVDPSFGAQVTVVGQFHFLVATMVYLAVNGHHFLLGALVRSYDVVPMGRTGLSPDLFDSVVLRFGELFKIALRMSLPAAICLLITEMSLGIAARAVPQMNVLMVGFPLKICVGLAVLVLAMPGFVGYVRVALGRLQEAIVLIIGAMRS